MPLAAIFDTFSIFFMQSGITSQGLGGQSSSGSLLTVQ